MGLVGTKGLEKRITNDEPCLGLLHKDVNERSVRKEIKKMVLQRKFENLLDIVNNSHRLADNDDSPE